MLLLKNHLIIEFEGIKIKGVIDRVDMFEDSMKLLIIRLLPI